MKKLLNKCVVTRAGIFEAVLGLLALVLAAAAILVWFAPARSEAQTATQSRFAELTPRYDLAENKELGPDQSSTDAPEGWVVKLWPDGTKYLQHKASGQIVSKEWRIDQDGNVREVPVDEQIADLIRDYHNNRDN